MNTSNYYSKGKIERLLIIYPDSFQFKNQTLEDLIKSAKKSIFSKLRYFYCDINAYHDIELVVAVFVKDYPFNSHHFSDELLNITYIFINNKYKGDSSKWTQDQLLIDEKNNIICRGGSGMVLIADELLKLKYISGVIQKEEITEGGELIIDNHIDNVFMIYANSQSLPTPLSELSSQLVHEFNVWQTGMNEKIMLPFFAHADMFLTSVIEPPKHSTPLLMISKVQSEYLEVPTLNEQINLLLNNVKKQLHEIRLDESKVIGFRMLTIPSIAIYNDSGSFVYPLTYNNCLVENYTEYGQQKVNIYFPDYNPIIEKQLLSEIMTQEKFSKSKIASIEPGKKTVEQKISEHKKLIAEIQQAQFNLQKLMEQEGIYNVTFVRYPFFQSASELGSLHCHVKVLKRSI